MDAVDPAVEVFRFAFLFCSVMDTGLPQGRSANTSRDEAPLTVSGKRTTVNRAGACGGSENPRPRRAVPALRG
ncbi:hypothetical protein GCM10018771_29300 [Streptomyces cellulosae]|nr:hypothetical protein GCM10018771_29300 [Streptomyces cellulosae]